jgi:hypothetical protein
VHDGNIVLELRGDALCLGEQSTALGGDLRTFALALGASPRKPVSYRALNAAVYDELSPQNTDRLRQLASELRRRLAALGLTPTNEYLPQGSRQGYLLMVGIEERSPFPERTATPANGRIEICPYKGLDVFNEEDAAFFAGREAFSDDLQRLVERTSLVALVGPSGSGKSSIVQAGLVPKLRSSHVPWDAVIFAPGDDPFFALASKLIPLLAPDLGPTDLMTERRRLASKLADGTLPLRDPLQEVRACGQFERLLLVVDQFEELFTLVRAETRRGFAESLLQLQERDNVCVLLTLRADFYGQAIALSRTLSDRLGQAVINVGALTREELTRAVAQPAASAGLSFQAGLVDTILADVGEEAGALPLLEFALLQLWQRRREAELTLEAYRSIGGVSGAIARQAQATYARLDADRQAIARRVLLRLVVPGDGGNHTRQRAAVADLLSRADPANVEGVVQVLINARLLTASRDALTGARYVEISHEALIRGWDALAEWIEAERDWLREQRRLTDAARDWRRQTDEALLYRGTRLADVQRLLAVHADELSRDEEEFLAHSRRLEARRERSRYLGQAAGGAVGTGFGYGAAFALGFAMSNPGPNGLILTGATFAFLFVVGQLSGFAIGVALWVWRAHTLPRILAAIALGGCVGMLGYLAFLRFLLNAESNLVRAAVGALVAGCLAAGLSMSPRRTRRLQGAVLGGVIGTAAAVGIGGITWSSPVTLVAGLTLGALSGAGFYLTSAEDLDRSVQGGSE